MGFQLGMVRPQGGLSRAGGLGPAAQQVSQGWQLTARPGGGPGGPPTWWNQRKTQTEHPWGLLRPWVGFRWNPPAGGGEPARSVGLVDPLTSQSANQPAATSRSQQQHLPATCQPPVGPPGACVHAGGSRRVLGSSQQPGESGLGGAAGPSEGPAAGACRLAPWALCSCRWAQGLCLIVLGPLGGSVSLSPPRELPADPPAPCL